MEKAKKLLQTADHLTYVTYPLLKEKRLLLKILEEISSSLLFAINSVLQYEYIYKRIRLYQDARENFETFKRISLRYNISDMQVRKIEDILSLTEKHKKSPFEFVRDEKIVIMSEGFKVESVSIEKIKEFIFEAKDILRKIDGVLGKF